MAGVASFELDNGMRVLLDPSPYENLVAISASVGAGLLTERGFPAGISHLVEHLVFKGNDAVTADDLLDRVAARGGNLNAYTFFDNTSYEAMVPSGDLAVPLETIRALLFEPTFPDREVEVEKRVVLEEIARERDSPDELIFDAEGALFYGRHPYGRSILGTTASIRGAAVGAIRAYHAARYVPGNVVLALAGGFDTRQVRAEIRRVFGKVPAAPCAPLDPDALAPLPAKGGRRRIAFRDASSGYGLCGWSAPAIGAPDFQAMNVTSALLGLGDNSFLNRRLSLELGLTASADIVYSPRRGPARLLVFFTFDPGDEPEILAEIAACVARLRAGAFGEAELDAARVKLEADHVYGLEQAYQRADSLALYATIDSHRNWLGTVAAIAAVTRADVLACAEKWLAGPSTTVLVAPAGGRS